MISFSEFVQNTGEQDSRRGNEQFVQIEQEWMSNLSEMRDQTSHLVTEFLANDAR